jgi:DNA mismatch repair protein MutL
VPIRILPPAVAAGIAAGEVIERPASVVKELVENSIDAGARAISVEIHQGGLQSIRVTDDGAGIPDDEADLAFASHATSKLVSLNALAQISTLGFRGEALASIAAASHVRMTTRTADATAATVVEATGADVTRRTKEAAAPGTTMLVEALFSTIPARLKFIRSAQAETSRIRLTLDHLAMAEPHIRFTLKSEQRTLLQSSGNGVLRDVFANVQGTELAAEMLELAPSALAPYPVHGLIGPPSRSRSNRTGISLFANGRWIASASLSTAIQEAYRGLLMEGRYPFAVLFIDVPPDVIDVNVHPNKREVRFRHDGDIFSSVERTVRETLLRADPTVEARGLFGSGLAPSSERSYPTAAPQAFDFTLAPGVGAWAPLPERKEPALPATDALPDDASDDVIENDPPVLLPWGMADLRVLGQISNTYIVAEGADGMHLIDQHAAHESVLYYRLLRQWEDRSAEVQPMLDPLPIELSVEQLDAVPVAQELLARYGITLEPFGDSTYLLRSLPAMARRVDGAKLVAEVLAIAAKAGALAPEIQHAVAASIACHSAVRAGQVLDTQEMEALIGALIVETNPNHCPHGRPTTLKVSKNMLEREFGRA